MILLVASGWTSSTELAVPSGWTAIGTPMRPTNNICLQVWTKVASGEPSSYTFDKTAVNANVVIILMAAAGDVLVNASAQRGDAPQTTAHTSAPVTTTSICDILTVWAIEDSANMTADAATVEFGEVDKAATFPVSLMIAKETQTATGVTTARTVTGANAHYAAMFTIALTSALVRELPLIASSAVVEGAAPQGHGLVPAIGPGNQVYAGVMSAEFSATLPTIGPDAAPSAGTLMGTINLPLPVISLANHVYAGTFSRRPHGKPFSALLGVVNTFALRADNGRFPVSRVGSAIVGTAQAGLDINPAATSATLDPSNARATLEDDNG